MATGGIFMYQDKYYTQTDGVTMGSPLGPTLANFIMAHFEIQLLNSDLECKPKIYLRYVDDIFCVFSSDHDEFFGALNSLHVNLKFTAEVGNQSIPFLDTVIQIVDAKFESHVYRKRTFTGVILNNSAMCPDKWKVGLAKCLLNRAWNICSSYVLLHQEIEKIREMFLNNGYSNIFFDKIVKDFIYKKRETKIDSEQKEENRDYVICLPYIGQPSLVFKRKIVKIYKQYFNVDISVVFKTCKVKQYFSLKSKTPLDLKTNVVYKFSCLRDANVSYVGKTKRHLVTRVKEHLKLKNSAIKQHIDNCNSCKDINITHFKILHSGTSDFNVKVKEALEIKRVNPTLNIQMYQNGASFLLNVF